MPSSSKTAFLDLNRWQGTDKPKRDDFNSDNQKIDAKVQQISSAVNGHEATLIAHETALNGLGNRVGPLEESTQSQAASLQTHANNSTIHVTQTERTLWNTSSAPRLYTYEGNGSLSRRLTLGVKPRCGILFTAGDIPNYVNVDAGLHEIKSIFFSEEGSCDGIVLNSDGFTVYQDGVPGADGSALKLNRTGIKYVCMYWV